MKVWSEVSTGSGSDPVNGAEGNAWTRSLPLAVLTSQPAI